MPTYQIQANQVLEIPLQTGKVYADPFNEVELDVVYDDSQRAAAAGARFLGRRPGMARKICLTCCR